MKSKLLHPAVALVAAMITIAISSLADDSTISVSARQRYPWNGLVDVHFTITGDAGTKYDTSFTAKDMVGNTNIAMRTIRKADGTAAAAKELLLPGTYNWVWDAAADLPKDFKCDRVTVTGTANEEPLYMVIDLSGGANASSYPVSYLDDVPSGGWSDAYKTTKLVLRMIEPGSFKMGGSYNVTLTKPFYIGVFEVTQKQYLLVKGSNPSDLGGDKRPVEMISYNAIRGSSNGAKWPSSTAVDAVSFMGKIRARTGLNFDLPTDAQWEYACRAGTTSSYNNGGSNETDLQALGRYNGNQSDGHGECSQHTVVGSYQPNAWGLYDMHGNVWEWVLYWYGNISGGTDPKGASSGTRRVIRGGGWHNDASFCTSSRRYSIESPGSFFSDDGFRICLTLDE